MKYSIALLLMMTFGAPSAGADGALPSEAVRGIVRPKSQASISSELAAPVARIGVKEGQSFARGDALINFDCRLQEAEFAAVEAEYREMDAAYQNAKYLGDRKAGGALDVETSKARLDKTTAQLQGLGVRLTRCIVTAPFDGRVAELSIHEHETPAAGRALLTVIETQAPEIELIVPSRWLKWLTQGLQFTFQIDETGTSEAAAVTRIGAAVDPVSQTIKVSGAFKATSSQILPGMSGTANFTSGER